MDKSTRSYSQAVQTLFLLVLVSLIAYQWKGGNSFLYLAMAMTFGGFISRPFVLLIDKGWMKIGWLLGQIVPRILLSVIFYIVLTPLALFSRWFGERDPLQLKRPDGSLFKKVTPIDNKESFEKMW